MIARYAEEASECAGEIARRQPFGTQRTMNGERNASFRVDGIESIQFGAGGDMDLHDIRAGECIMNGQADAGMCLISGRQIKGLRAATAAEGRDQEQNADPNRGHRFTSPSLWENGCCRYNRQIRCVKLSAVRSSGFFVEKFRRNDLHEPDAVLTAIERVPGCGHRAAPDAQHDRLAVPRSDLHRRLDIRREMNVRP